jgi:tRNA U34 5-carboxymethylaminomethyl modifying enzyme MnmG/GidA
MEASMNAKIMVGISALVSLIYVVADEIAVNYMLAAANGAAVAATARPAVDLVAVRREAQAAVKDLQNLQQLASTANAVDRTHCREQAWPYYSGACLATADERPVRTVSHGSNSAVTAAGSNVRQAASF